MATFTTFCFGTGESRNMAKDNIISKFSTACTTPKCIIDGPGMLGTEVPANTQLGVNQIMHWLSEQETAQNTLNLTGFSRGSVTCIRIANQLKSIERNLRRHARSAEDRAILAKLQGLEINIFANDPVAGMSDKSVIENRVIPSNVRNYVAVLQTDEMRRDFKPQDMSRAIIASSRTNVSMLPMYGNHSDCTKQKSDGMKMGPELVWYALHNFFTEHGTTFENGQIPQMVDKQRALRDLDVPVTPRRMLEKFAGLHAERDAYLASGRKVKLVDGMPVARKTRSFNKHIDYYVREPAFFVNQLERELFKVSYPKVFNYLFEKNINDPRFPDDQGDPQAHRAEVIAEIRELQQTNPVLFERLNEMGYIDHNLEQAQGIDNIGLGEPSGTACLEPLNTTEQLFPDFLPDDMQMQNQSFKALAQLEAEVNRMTFRYEREKSSMNPSSPRRLASEAQAIRAAVKEIVESRITQEGVTLDEPYATDLKREQIILLLESHYTKLLKADHDSDLRFMLRSVLRKHGYQYHVENNAHILRSLLAETVRGLCNVVKEALSFTLNLGYIGGAVLTTVGIFIEDIGRRLEHCIGGYGSSIALNVLKTPFLGLAKLFQGVGFLVKYNFGLKPIANFVNQVMRFIRDSMVSAIDGVTVERQDVENIDNQVDRFRQAKERFQHLLHQNDPQPQQDAVDAIDADVEEDAEQEGEGMGVIGH